MDYYERDVNRAPRLAKYGPKGELNLDAATMYGTQAGKEDPTRPKPIEIWKNRKLNLK